jgi:hypothetical protein
MARAHTQFMSRRLPSSPAQKPRLNWTFVRSLVRGYIFCAQVYLLLGLRLPERTLRLLPIVEKTVRGILFAMLTDPAGLARFKPRKRRKNAPPLMLAPVNISRAEFRARIEKLKAILDDPRAEIARLQAWIAANRVRVKKLHATHPHITADAPSTDDLVHACARALFTPQARPPPPFNSAPKTKEPDKLPLARPFVLEPIVGRIERSEIRRPQPANLTPRAYTRRSCCHPDRGNMRHRKSACAGPAHLHRSRQVQSLCCKPCRPSLCPPPPAPA